MNMQTVHQILKDQGTHFWVKDQYKAANQRDIVDAINDAEILVEMLKARFAQLTQGIPCSNMKEFDAIMFDEEVQ